MVCAHHFTDCDSQAIFRKWYVNGIDATRLKEMKLCVGEILYHCADFS